MNGSSATGNCSSIAISTHDGLSRCDAPNSSVLFDGNIPTLTGLDEDMWACQLLILQVAGSSRRDILSDFTGKSSYVGVRRVELAMFNCPEWGISVQTIKLLTATSLSQTALAVSTFSVPAITSCDSLVRICISEIIQQPVIALEFSPPPGSNWTHLAEVTFYGTGSCPPDTIITTSPPDATPRSDPTTSEMLTSYSNSDTATTTVSSSSSATITVMVTIGCVVLLIVCLLAAVLILWRCYYVKHRKHKTSHHPAVGEGHANTRSHPPPVTLCEETGQVYYSTPQEVVPQESNDTHSHTHHDTTTGRGVSKKSRGDTVAEDVEMGGYSMLSYGDKPQDGGLDNQNEEMLLTPAKQDLKNEAIGDDGLHAMSVYQLQYTQVDKKKEKDGDTTHLHTPETDTPVDQLYAQVDKKKKKDGDTTHSHVEIDTSTDQLYAQVDKKKKKKDKDTTHSQAEIDTPTDQLYAQVDKKKKDGDTTHSHAEIDTPMDQLYAKVDKKKSKGEEVCEDSPQESGAVYSIVKKPHPPQLPAKNQTCL